MEVNVCDTNSLDLSILMHCLRSLDHAVVVGCTFSLCHSSQNSKNVANNTVRKQPRRSSKVRRCITAL